MKSKQNDLMLNILANPQFSIGDFQKVGFNADNTSLEDENTYLGSEQITQNPLFQNENGEFDQVKFHNVYLQAAKGMEQINSEPQDFEAVYSKYNIWAPTSQRENSPGYELTKIYNPDRITKSMITIGQNESREYTPQEIAQSQKVWNSEKQEWMDNPEDMFSFNKLFSDFTGFFSDNFGSTKVMAQYEEDEDINGKKRGEIGFNESQIEHHKGDYMLNENGTYYYRTLKDGENIYGKQLLHYSDILTKEGSALNSVDFLDSDDIQKSGFGSFVKNASLIGSFFLPYVGTAIAGATIFQQAAGLGATLGKIALGEDNSTMNWLEGLSESTNPLNTRSEWSSIDYGNTGRNTTWTIENLLGMVGDVVGQLKQQRLLFEYSPALIKGKWGMLDSKKQKALEDQYFKELQLATRGKVLSKIEKGDPNFLEAATKLEAINRKKAADAVADYMKAYQKTGEELSKAYMTLLTVNDIYGEAIEAGAEEFDAALITAGYAAMEYWLLSTDIGKWILPEMRGERLQNKALVHALTKDVKDSFKKLSKAAGESDEATKTYLQRLVEFGKNVAKGEFNAGLGKRAAFTEGTGLLKSGVGSVFAGASAEAVEETSEELLADFSRVLFNGLQQLKGNDVRLKPFENITDRYGMSFLGGFIGGGVSSATFDFSNARRAVNMTYDQAMQEVIHKAHNNNLDGIYKILDKEEVGNKNLSAKRFDKDEKGNIIWKQGDENDNQDLEIKGLVRRQLQLIQNTLDAHGGKTDDEFLDDQIMRDLRFRALRDTTTAGLFIQKYNETLTDLVKKVQELKELDTPIVKAENGEGDKKEDKSEDLELRRKKLNEEIKAIDEKLEQFHTGAKAPLFMATALIESTPFIAKTLMAPTFKFYAEYKSNKKFEDISEAELKDLETKYQNYLKTDKKDDLQLATKSYLIMESLIKGNLEAIQDIMKKQAEDSTISTLLQNTSDVFGRLNFEQDPEKWQEQFSNWASGATSLGKGIAEQINLLYNTYQEQLQHNQKVVDDIYKTKNDFNLTEQNLTNQLSQIDQNLAQEIQQLEEQYAPVGEFSITAEAELEKNTSIKEAQKRAETTKQELNKKLEELNKQREDYTKAYSDQGIDINNDDSLEEFKNKANKEVKKNLDETLQTLIFDSGVQQANKLADIILSQGFINGAIKDQVIDKLTSMSKTLEQTYKKAENAFWEMLESDIDPLSGLEDPSQLADLSIEDALTFVKNPEQYKKEYEDLQKYVQSKQELDTKIEQIKKLGYSPVMNNLDAFALTLGKGKVSQVFNEIGKILSSSRENVSQFTINGTLYKQLREAERVIDLYIAALEGARVDTVDPFKIDINADGTVTDKSNIWGINKVINEVHAKAPKIDGEKWVDLPEIEGQIADMMIEDAKRLKNYLHTSAQLYSINQGQKLNVQKRVSTKTHYLLYQKLAKLITFDIPDKEELEQSLNSLTFLKEQTSKNISDWNINLNQEQEKQLEKERIQMEDAVYKYFQDKVNSIEDLKKIINPVIFSMNNSEETLLSEMTENIDDTSFIGYLATKASLKSSSFQKKFKEILRDGTIAPIIGQELAAQLGLANILNGSVITNFIKAYRESILEIPKDKRAQFFKDDDERYKKALSTDAGWILFVNHDLVPQYDNITFIDGIPGAGKSKAVDALIYKYLNAYHKDVLKNTWVCHGGDVEGGKITKDFASDIGFEKDYEHAYDKNSILKNIFPDYIPVKPDDSGNYPYTKDDYIIDKNGKIHAKWKVDNKWTSENVPKVIFIDEAQKFSQLELVAIDDFAKKFGIAVIMSGDLDQSQMHAKIDLTHIIKKVNEEVGEKLIQETNTITMSLKRTQVLHSFKLGTSMRTSNNQKNTNMANTRTIMKKGSGNLELHYFDDGNTIAGDFQLETLTIEPVIEWLDKMIPLLSPGEKIHFACPKNDDFKTKLKAIEKYNKVLEFHDGVALGQEGKFWIVKFNKVNDIEFKQDFYTGQTRSQQFTLMLTPSSVQDGAITITNVQDQETHPEEFNNAAIQKYSNEYVKILDEVVDKNAEDIPYNPRTPETPEGAKKSDDVEIETKKSTPTKTPEEIKEERKKLVSALEQTLDFAPIEESSELEISEEENEKVENLINSLIDTINHLLDNNSTLDSETLHNIEESIDNFLNDPDISEEVKREVQDELNDLLNILDGYDGYVNKVKIGDIISIHNSGNGSVDWEWKVIGLRSIPRRGRIVDLINPSNGQHITIDLKDILDNPSKYEINPPVVETTPEGDPFDSSEEPELEEISIIEDLPVEDAKDKLDEDSIIETAETKEPSDTPPGFSLKTFRFTLFSNATFEVGTAEQDKVNNTYKLESDRYENYRIDGVNGIENPLITNSKWVEIRNIKNLRKAEEKLAFIRRLLMSQYLTKSEMAQFISRDMGISGDLFIRFAIKTSQFDIDFEERNSPYKKLEKSGGERLNYARAQKEKNSESNYVNNRNLVAIIGTDQNGDIIEIPLLTFNNPITIIRSLDEDDEVRRIFDTAFLNSRANTEGGRQIDGLKAVMAKYKDNPEMDGLTDLVSLYLATYRHILFIPDKNWTPRELDSLGVQFNKKRGLKNYNNADYRQTRVYNTLNQLKADPTLMVSNPMQLNDPNKKGIISGPGGQSYKLANPKHPFVLYTDQVFDHNKQPLISEQQLIDEFLYQLFTPNVPQTVQLVYILPPELKFRDYVDSLIKFMTQKGPSPYGNQRTAYKILEGIYSADAENNFENVKQCFINALGEADGLALFNKTGQIIHELTGLVNSEGEPDIDKQIKILTTRTESWSLGETNVGIPKAVPLYRQLQNVIKQLVYPQSVRTDFTDEEGMSIYISREGSDRRDELMGPLETLFNKSERPLYHQTIGKKTSTGLFRPIEVKLDGDKVLFTDGQEFQLNGSIASQAYDSTEAFNNTLHNLVKNLRDPNTLGSYYTKSGEGYYISTPDNSKYVWAKNSGWGSRSFVKTDESPIIHPSLSLRIRNKIQRTIPGINTAQIEYQIQRVLTKENDESPEVLKAVADFINQTYKDNKFRAIVIGNDLLIGESNEFKNRDVKFGPIQMTSRGAELEVTIDETKYDGTFVNGILTLQTEINSSQNNQVPNNISIEDILANESQWGIPTRPANIFKQKLYDYQTNPTPEKLKEIQNHIVYKKMLKILNISTNNDISNDTCSLEIKIKFN